MRLACWFVILLLCSATLGKKKEKEFKYEPKETSKTVKERKLLDEQIFSTSVVKESASYYVPSQRTFAGPTLGYITPWNNQGYAFATLFKDKFDYFSPCWYLIRPESLEFVGDHEVNSTWMKSVKPAKILPRFLFDSWNKNHFASFFANKNQQTQAISKIVELCDTYSFDGIVVDTGYIGLTINRQQQVEFYKTLASSLKLNGKLIILVVPPHFEGYNIFGAQELQELSKSLDHISIMTYDFSREGAGPNSPLHWWYRTLFNLVPPDQRGNNTLLNKLLFGVNFYGYDYASNGKKDAILGSKFLEILNKHKPQFEWEESSHEHRIEYKDKSVSHTVYFPTPLFLQDRLHFASQSNCGIAVWEIGQGLHYFYDLL